MPAMGEQVRALLQARADQIKDRIDALKATPELQKIKEDIDMLVADVKAALDAALNQ